MTGVQVRGGLSIGQVAAETGLPIDTVRYYERARLLPPPPRVSGAHRRYPESVLDRLRFIRGAQRLGLRLAEIRDLLAVRDTGVCPCEPAEMLLRRHLADIDAEMARLAALRGELTDMVTRMPGPGCPDPAPGTWCPPVTADLEGR
jgi:DNA-binding transcriptional MerR regulator